MAESEKESGKKEGETAPAPTADKSKQMLYIIIGVLSLVLVIGTPTLILVLKSGDKKQVTTELDSRAAAHMPQAESESVLAEEQIEESEEVVGAILPLETFVVNLSGGKYLRVQIQYEFEGRDIPKRFYSKIVPIRDAIITLLAKKTADELAGEKGRDILKDELKGIVNQALNKEEVKKAYFTQFLVQ